MRVYCAVTTELAEEARKIHNTYPVATAALGRIMTGALMMGVSSLKNETDSLTLRMNGGGELGNLIAVADSGGGVRGYVGNPFADLPLNPLGKLDVGGAVGRDGTLSVIKDMGLKEPYVGQIPIKTGEIAEDITEYFAVSEQIPSCVALGVLVDRDYSVLASGGYMIQLMPGASDELAEQITRQIRSLKPVSSMINSGMSAKELFFTVTDGFSMLMQNETIHPEYRCTCSKERMEKALISIGKKDLEDLINTDGHAELCCQFCNNKYDFKRAELEEILARAK